MQQGEVNRKFWLRVIICANVFIKSISVLLMLFYIVKKEWIYANTVYLRNTGGSDSKMSAFSAGGPGFDPWVAKTPWRRKWQPTPVLLPGKFHGWRSLVGYSPWDLKRVWHDWSTLLSHSDIVGWHKSDCGTFNLLEFTKVFYDLDTIYWRLIFCQL